MDAVFVADIVLTFRTTFFDAENELVLDKRVIARNYLKWWFPTGNGHFVSLLPR